MSRLTMKIENPQYMNDYELLVAHNYHLYNKLGKLEDLEDELGCPLDVVANKKAMIVKDSELYEVDIMAVSFTNGNIYFGTEWSFTTRKVKEYGKTWWLKSDRRDNDE